MYALSPTQSKRRLWWQADRRNLTCRPDPSLISRVWDVAKKKPCLLDITSVQRLFKFNDGFGKKIVGNKKMDAIWEKVSYCRIERPFAQVLGTGIYIMMCNEGGPRAAGRKRRRFARRLYRSEASFQTRGTVNHTCTSYTEGGKMWLGQIRTQTWVTAFSCWLSTLELNCFVWPSVSPKLVIAKKANGLEFSTIVTLSPSQT